MIHDCGAAVCFVSTQAQLDKLVAVRDAMPACRTLVFFDADVRPPEATGLRMMSLADLENLGRDEGDRAEVDRRVAALTRDDLLTVLSGASDGLRRRILTSVAPASVQWFKQNLAYFGALYGLRRGELAARIAKTVHAVVIGIGAGPDTDGQVLVVNDLAGVTRREFRHNKRYGAVGAALRDAVRSYVEEVRSGAFPGPENAFAMPPEERVVFERMRP